MSRPVKLDRVASEFSAYPHQVANGPLRKERVPRDELRIADERFGNNDGSISLDELDRYIADAKRRPSYGAVVAYVPKP